MQPRLIQMLKDAALTALVAAALGIFVVGFRTVDVGSRTGLSFDYHLIDLAVALVIIFFGRLGLSMVSMGLRWPAITLGVVMIAAGASPMKLPSGFLHWFVALGGVMLVIRAAWPWANGALKAAAHTPTGRVVDRIGNRWLGWLLLAIAIVTLGFGEIIRLVLLNWTDFTNGPAGIGSIPGPTLFGAVFAETAPAGGRTVSELLGIPFHGIHRLIFLYYLILVLALVTNLFTQRMRRLPVGRAWEALREDETACKALGINPTNTKLTAFAVGAMFAGFAGSFFAAKQRFISPESFVFIESAIILAIVVLGGMGSQIGVVLASVLLIGLPEWFRDLGSYRMLAFGLAMVLIMVFRPRGLIAHREPSIRLHPARAGAGT